jgi:hypothetical protein
VATIITAFCLASSKVLLGQALYKGQVISARHKAIKQINTDISSANAMIKQYNEVFIGDNPVNAIGGKNDPDPLAQPPNGDNGRLVLDALPSTYDFPAVLSTMSRVLSMDSIGSPSIGGTDQAVTTDSRPTEDPKPSSIDLTVNGTGSYTNTTSLIKDLERSIRPFDITHLTLGGNESSLTVGLNLSTYYQQAKTVNIVSKKVK